MKKLMKYTLILVLGLFTLLLAAFGSFYFKVESKRNTPVIVNVSSLPLPVDEDSLREGHRLVQVKACADCHGPDLGGKIFINDPALGQLVGTNLTRGKGSAIANYKDEDWVRAIRYGIGSDHLPLNGMPAGDFHGISNAELGKMIAYLKTLPPVDRENPPTKFGPMAYVLSSLGQLPLLFPFEEVDLNAKPVEDVKVAENLEYGKYLSQACTGCHGPGFGGGHIPGTPPSWPDAKNITPSGKMGQWSYEDFKRVLTQGKTPDNHQIDSQYMPWKSMAAMTETEMRALYMYLKQVPNKETGTR